MHFVVQVLLIHADELLHQGVATMQNTQQTEAFSRSTEYRQHSDGKILFSKKTKREIINERKGEGLNWYGHKELRKKALARVRTFHMIPCSCRHPTWPPHSASSVLHICTPNPIIHEHLLRMSPEIFHHLRDLRQPSGRQVWIANLPLNVA